MPTAFSLSKPIGESVRVNRGDTLRTKRALRRLGFLSSVGDEEGSVIGSSTIEGVRAFQRKNGLFADGSMKPDGPTARLINAALVEAERGNQEEILPVFRVNAAVGNRAKNRPEDVAATKRALALADFIAMGDVNSKMAKHTFIGAIDGFQRAFNLKRDGKIAPGGETETTLSRIVRSVSIPHSANAKNSTVIAANATRSRSHASGAATGQAKIKFLSDDQVAHIIFNESRSLSGSRIDDVRRIMAHAIINGAEKLQQGRPKTASDVLPNNISPLERQRLRKIRRIVSDVRLARQRGIDDANGAMFFNFRDRKIMSRTGKAMTSNRDKQIFVLNVGPLSNSFPTVELGRKNIFFTLFK